MAGQHEDAISRVDGLIAAVEFNSIFYVVQVRAWFEYDSGTTYFLPQAYMHLLIGNSLMERSDYDSAIQSFKLALAQLGIRTDQPPLVVSLVISRDLAIH